MFFDYDGMTKREFDGKWIRMKFFKFTIMTDRVDCR